MEKQISKKKCTEGFSFWEEIFAKGQAVSKLKVLLYSRKPSRVCGIGGREELDPQGSVQGLGHEMWTVRVRAAAQELPGSSPLSMQVCACSSGCCPGRFLQPTAIGPLTSCHRGLSHWALAQQCSYNLRERSNFYFILSILRKVNNNKKGQTNRFKSMGST